MVIFFRLFLYAGYFLALFIEANSRARALFVTCLAGSTERPVFTFMAYYVKFLFFAATVGRCSWLLATFEFHVAMVTLRMESEKRDMEFAAQIDTFGAVRRENQFTRQLNIVSHPAKIIHYSGTTIELGCYECTTIDKSIRSK